MMLRRFALSVAIATAALILGCGGAAKESSDSPASEGRVSWEPGEWAFDAELEPWPATSGVPVTLRAIASVDDNDEPFSGTVSYKLASSSSSGDWTRMPRVGSDEGDSVYESTITLPDERVGIHFLVSRANDGTTHELTDWSVSPR